MLFFCSTDCRSGECTNVIRPNKKYKSMQNTWISSVAVDPSESWLVHMNNNNMSLSLNHLPMITDLMSF
jgi:hypothetical protein